MKNIGNSIIFNPDKKSYMAILSLQNITKNYGSLRALNGISFEVPPKTVFGILGPNGSGKTTLLGIVMDILKATDGTYQWMGEKSSPAIRKKIGTLLETPNFYHYMSAVDNLRIAARIKGASEDDIPKILETVKATTIIEIEMIFLFIRYSLCTSFKQAFGQQIYMFEFG